MDANGNIRSTDHNLQFHCARHVKLILSAINHTGELISEWNTDLALLDRGFYGFYCIRLIPFGLR